MCEELKIPNDRGGVDTFIVCGVRENKQFCACGRRAVALCDWKVRGRKSGTCDAPMCVSHSREVARGKHLCPTHSAAYEQWKQRHPPAQGSLFAEAT